MSTPEGSCTIVLFHSVDSRDLLSLRDLGNIRPEVFEAAAKILKKEFDVVSIREALGWIKDGARPKDRLLSITFDDGAKSYATEALPIMEALQIPSTCFLITGFLGDKAHYWRYLYNCALHGGLGRELIGLVAREYGIETTVETVMSLTRSHFDQSRTVRIVKVLRGLLENKGCNEPEEELFLSMDDIDRLKTNPLVTFGIHTGSHPVMSGLSDSEIREELSKSLDFYLREIDDGIPILSIPFGRLYRDYDERVVLAAQELGVGYIFSAYGGSNTKGQPAFNIRRIPVDEDMIGGEPEELLKLLERRFEADDYGEAEKRLYRAVAGGGNGLRKTRFS